MSDHDMCGLCNHPRWRHAEERGGRCGFRTWDRIRKRWIYCDCKAFDEGNDDD